MQQAYMQQDLINAGSQINAGSIINAGGVYSGIYGKLILQSSLGLIGYYLVVFPSPINTKSAIKSPIKLIEHFRPKWCLHMGC